MSRTRYYLTSFFFSPNEIIFFLHSLKITKLISVAIITETRMEIWETAGLGALHGETKVDPSSGLLFHTPHIPHHHNIRPSCISIFTSKWEYLLLAEFFCHQVQPHHTIVRSGGCFTSSVQFDNLVPLVALLCSSLQKC